jgi:alkanesulfonate monooxygenase SsuD/methylene tetrahydromethanopterin reductase-like flavin-dependent oxidoreductase (luciferase family)
MRIGLTGGGSSTDRIVEQALRAEQEGFSSLWYASSVAGDPLAAITVAGRSTSSMELGTAVLQTYPCHPLLQVNRAAAVVELMGRPGFTLGIGPSHETLVRDVYGLSYDQPGSNTEVAGRVPVLLSAMSPRRLRVCAQFADGAVLWMASARAIEMVIAPRLHVAASATGRAAPRIVAGLPVAVHDDIAEARAAAAATAQSYAGLPNYQRVLNAAGLDTPADAAVVGDEKSVRAQLNALLKAGATDIWAATFAVGHTRDEGVASLRRTKNLLRELAG